MPVTTICWVCGLTAGDLLDDMLPIVDLDGLIEG